MDPGKKNKKKIGHSLEELQDGLILTLQDKPVLLNGEVNQDDDVLQNFQKRAENEAQHNKELKEKLKVISNAATSHLEAMSEGKKTLLPHYDDHTYKSDELDLQDGSIIKRSKPKVMKNLASDFETNQNVNSEYYQRSVKFKKNFLNQTAVEKDVKEQEQTYSAADIIEESLNTVRKRRNIEKQSNQIAAPTFSEDDQLLEKAMKIKRTKVEPVKLLDMIKEQQEDNDNDSKQKPKFTEIQLNPVTFKKDQANIEAKKIYNIEDIKSGTTSCLFVNLPTEKMVKNKQEVQEPTSFEKLTPEQIEKMKQEISFLEQKDECIGLSGTLQFLRKNNLMNREEQFGRTNDRESHHNNPGDRIKLEYRNASGKLMKPKQAFRYMSAIFHGQGPSKNKIQKIKKKQLQQERLKQAASRPSKFMSLLQQHQGKTGEAHMKIQLGSKNKQAD